MLFYKNHCIRVSHYVCSCLMRLPRKLDGEYMGNEPRTYIPIYCFHKNRVVCPLGNNRFSILTE